MKNPWKDVVAKIQGILVAKMGGENGRSVSRHDEHKLVAKEE